MQIVSTLTWKILSPLHYDCEHYIYLTHPGDWIQVQVQKYKLKCVYMLNVIIPSISTGDQFIYLFILIFLVWSEMTEGTWNALMRLSDTT